MKRLFALLAVVFFLYPVAEAQRVDCRKLWKCLSEICRGNRFTNDIAEEVRIVIRAITDKKGYLSSEDISKVEIFCVERIWRQMRTKKNRLYNFINKYQGKELSEDLGREFYFELKSIVYNAFKDVRSAEYLKMDKKLTFIDESFALVHTQTPYEILLIERRNLLLQEAIDKLTETQKRRIERYMSGMTIAKIVEAEPHSVNEKNVRKSLKEAFHKLSLNPKLAAAFMFVFFAPVLSSEESLKIYSAKIFLVNHLEKKKEKFELDYVDAYVKYKLNTIQKYYIENEDETKINGIFSRENDFFLIRFYVFFNDLSKDIFFLVGFLVVTVSTFTTIEKSDILNMIKSDIAFLGVFIFIYVFWGVSYYAAEMIIADSVIFLLLCFFVLFIFQLNSEIKEAIYNLISLLIFYPFIVGFQIFLYLALTALALGFIFMIVYLKVVGYHYPM